MDSRKTMIFLRFKFLFIHIWRWLRKSEQHNISAHLTLSVFKPSVSRNKPNKPITVKFKPLANDANTDGSHRTVSLAT